MDVTLIFVLFVSFMLGFLLFHVVWFTWCILDTVPPLPDATQFHWDWNWNGESPRAVHDFEFGL